MELRTYLLVLWRKRCLVLTAFLSTLLATMVFTFLQTPVYEAASTFVVSPTGTYRDAEALAGVLDAMSRRAELANTYAEVAASRSIKEEAADELRLSEAQRDDLTVDSRLLAGTNVLEITVRGSDAELVAVFADEIGALTANYTRALYEAYGLKPLDMADLPTSPVQPNKLLNLALGAALGLALGVGLAFLAYYLEVPPQQAASHSLQGALPGTPQEAPVVTARTSSLGKARWILVGLLTLAVIGMGSTLLLSKPRTSAAALPVTRPIATFVPAAVWTTTPTATPTDATLLAMSPTPTPTPCGYPWGWVAYEVQAVDTLTSLAERYDMSVAEIVDANCLTRRVISAGQVLYFPPAPETPTPVPSITVTEGVTLTSESVAPRLEAVTRAPQPSPTPRPVSSPSGGRSAKATPLPTETASPSLPAPVLLAPADGAEFTANSEIVLAWQPVPGLPPDAYYAITVAYPHLGRTWFDDVPWTRDTAWTLSEHDYLLELSDDGQFVWSVQVMRQVGTEADGTLEGEALSDPSVSRKLTWRLPSSGSGPAEEATPVVPAP